MKTKTINLYSFQELSKQAQKKAHSNWIAHNDCYYLTEYLTDYLKEKLTENKIKYRGDSDLKVYYSLSSNQGDGCMFEGHLEWNGYNIDIKQKGHYYHENSKEITITDEEGNEPETDEPETAFNDIYVSICKELEKAGYNYIEAEDDLENFKEACESNEYTFLENAEMENL